MSLNDGLYCPFTDFTTLINGADVDIQEQDDDQRAIDKDNMAMLERLFKDVADELLQKPVSPPVIAFGLQEALLHVATESRHHGLKGSEILDMVSGNIADMAMRFRRIEADVDAKRADKLERVICRTETHGTA